MCTYVNCLRVIEVYEPRFSSNLCHSLVYESTTFYMEIKSEIVEINWLKIDLNIPWKFGYFYRSLHWFNNFTAECV